MTETADIETEIRRLRVRIIGLTTAQLAEAGENSPVADSGERPSRRATIAEALAEFSAIGSEGRPVPELNDESLPDQVVVLLSHGMRTASELPETDCEEMLAALLDAAVRLRRALA